MNNVEKIQMEKFGITRTTQSTYHYGKHRYSKLSDAINYAKIDTERKSEHNTDVVSDNG